MQQELTLAKDTPATVIPAGDKVTLKAGSPVFITQTLGGNVTVRTDGGLFRIAKENARLIDGYAAADEAGAVNKGVFSEQAVWDVLKTCFDPEIPVNIVDLGLVYDVKVADSGVCNITMTLTSQACPEARTIPDVMKRRVNSIPGITGTEIQIVWDPAWTPQLISPEGRSILGIESEEES